MTTLETYAWRPVRPDDIITLVNLRCRYTGSAWSNPAFAKWVGLTWKEITGLLTYPHIYEWEIYAIGDEQKPVKQEPAEALDPDAIEKRKQMRFFFNL